MGNSADKKKQQLLQDQQAKAEAERTAAIAAANKPSELESAVEKSRQEDINYFNRDTPDYSVAPKGMIDSTVFQRAALNRLRSRTATGGAQMGAAGADPTLLALNRERNDAETAQEGGANYATQLADRRTEAYGGSDALINLQASRALNLAGLATSHEGTASTNYANFKPAPSIWAQLALAGVGAAGAVGAAYAGKP